MKEFTTLPEFIRDPSRKNKPRIHVLECASKERTSTEALSHTHTMVISHLMNGTRMCKTIDKMLGIHVQELKCC